jgi:FMN phosphatase YigB (HAD superfamily)
MGVIDAVVFDVGETLVDETTEYGTWADWLGVPRHTFSAIFGAVIASGRDHREVFQYFRPGFDPDAERKRRAAAGRPETFGEADLYPDARPCLAALRDMGLWVGIAGNQTSRAGTILRGLNLAADLIGTSEDWRAMKPDAAFFEAVAAAAPCPAGKIVYVGDRLDNDLKPAKAAGMRTAFIRRGPWGYAWEYHPDLADAADWRVTSLAELPPLLADVNQLAGGSGPLRTGSPGRRQRPVGVPHGSGRGAGELKPMLVDFALLPRSDPEFSAVVAESLPEARATMLAGSGGCCAGASC